MPHRDVAIRFVRWTCMRAVFHRGYWLVTSLYLVVDADLSAFQLVFLGTAQGLTALACEVPTGVMADTISRKRSIVASGIAMLVLGLFVATRFTEHHFTPTCEHRWRKSASIFRRGARLARRDPEILLVFAATILVNGAAEAFGRLFPKRLVELGFPAQLDPIGWLTALGLVTLAIGALALRIVEARIDGVGVARRVYAAACCIGALGLIVVAGAPDDVTAMAGVVLVSGIALTVTRCVSVIWVNRRASSDVRATVQSFLAQAEYCGEIFLGISLAILAQATSIATAMMGSCALVACAGVLVVRSRAGRAPRVEVGGG